MRVTIGEILNGGLNLQQREWRSAAGTSVQIGTGPAVDGQIECVIGGRWPDPPHHRALPLSTELYGWPDDELADVRAFARSLIPSKEVTDLERAEATLRAGLACLSVASLFDVLEELGAGRMSRRWFMEYVDVAAREEAAIRGSAALVAQPCPVCSTVVDRQLGFDAVVFAKHHDARGGPCRGSEETLAGAFTVAAFWPFTGKHSTESRLEGIRQRTLVELRWLMQHGTAWGLGQQLQDEAARLVGWWERLQPTIEAVSNADLAARGRLHAAAEECVSPPMKAAIERILRTVPADLTAVGQRIVDGRDTEPGRILKQAMTGRGVSPPWTGNLAEVAQELGLPPETAAQVAQALTGRTRGIARRLRATMPDTNTLQWLLRVERAGPARPPVIRVLEAALRGDWAGFERSAAEPEPAPETPEPAKPEPAGPVTIRAEALRKVRMPDGSWDLWRVDGPIPMRVAATGVVASAVDVVRELIPGAEHDPVGTLEQLARVLRERGYEPDFRLRLRPGRKKSA